MAFVATNRTEDDLVLNRRVHLVKMQDPRRGRKGRYDHGCT